MILTKTLIIFFHMLFLTALHFLNFNMQTFNTVKKFRLLPVQIPDLSGFFFSDENDFVNVQSSMDLRIFSTDNAKLSISSKLWNLFLLLHWERKKKL